jgi:hypothetical protein
MHSLKSPLTAGISTLVSSLQRKVFTHLCRYAQGLSPIR